MLCLYESLHDTQQSVMSLHYILLTWKTDMDECAYDQATAAFSYISKADVTDFDRHERKLRWREMSEKQKTEFKKVSEAVTLAALRWSRGDPLSYQVLLTLQSHLNATINESAVEV